MTDRKILNHTFEEYVTMVESFHGAAAPGVIMGGFMVDLARKNLDRDALYNVICETAKCLPDAVQLLTPCSIGNRWLKIINVSRYALTFYNKRTGEGVRVFLDHTKLERWPEIRDWYLKRKTKEMLDKELLLAQIREAGSDPFGIEEVAVDVDATTEEKSPIAICPSCNEAHDAAFSALCPACRDGSLPYITRAPSRWGNAILRRVF